MKKLWLFALPLSVMASDLQELVQKVQASEMVQSLSYAVQAQQKVKGAVIANYLPTLKGSYAYSYVPKDYRGLFDPKNAVSLVAQAVLFDGFKRSETIMAQNSRIASTKASKKFQVEKLSLTAVNLYFNMKSIEANINAKKQKQKQFEEELQRLERFFKAGNLTQDKVEQVRAALAMTKFEITYLEQSFQDLALSMQTLTGVAIKHVGNATLKEALQEGKQESFEVQSMKHEIQALDHDAKTKTAGYWPTIVVKDTLQDVEYYPADLPATFGDKLSLPSLTNKIQLAASMTLWDTLAKVQERQAVELQKQAKKSELSYKQRDLSLKQKFAKVKLQTTKAKIRSLVLNVQASKKSFDFIAEQLKANLVDSSVYLDAASNYYNAKAMLEGAKNEYQMALANYYFYNNIPLLEMIK